ncbi:ChrR family anti-sigma-E factor [Motiliproteus sediminis]|uniref:ChrR family anti-sigma-E factor n=1 Tax=Motiliproteus sediminis TaxID=1468178 RepID=UPI001AF01B0E|nr:ChrR family anti-sigma-E factor [Motiliproteus sediminis]
MTLSHHPDDASLASFAAGGSPQNFACVMQLHLDQCDRCRQRVGQAETLAGLFFGQQPADRFSAASKSRLMAMLDQPADESPSARPRGTPVPELLRDWSDQQVDQLPWRRIAPGIKQVRFPEVSGDLYLLRIAPGTCLPEHGHGGGEMTLVLSGSYSDEIGRFTPGNVADLDDSIEHQPIADRNRDCICLVATDAPLRFKDWAPRLFQRLLNF